MGKSTSSKIITKEEVREALMRSGYLLESRVEQQLRKLGFCVEAHASHAGVPSAYGLGDTEFGVKYRFVQETDRRPFTLRKPNWSFLKKWDCGSATTRIQSIPRIDNVMTGRPCGGGPFSEK